jgi:hypothetical protein
LKPKVPLEVGGPAFTMYNEEWLRAFLDSYKADPSLNKRLDFISYHAYGEFPKGGGDTGGPQAYHFYKGNPSEVAGQRAKLEAELRKTRPRRAHSEFHHRDWHLSWAVVRHSERSQARLSDRRCGCSLDALLVYGATRTVPFNWVLRHRTEERKDQLVTRVGEGKPIPTASSRPMATHC